ncbi:hypothetical protein OG21DRAFT_1052217 [Imleria badia]|nr:hypothetical protein OG21DRAFT_1052217 [Imleria badia]
MSLCPTRLPLRIPPLRSICRRAKLREHKQTLAFLPFVFRPPLPKFEPHCRRSRDIVHLLKMPVREACHRARFQLHGVLDQRSASAHNPSCQHAPVIVDDVVINIGESQRTSLVFLAEAAETIKSLNRGPEMRSSMSRVSVETSFLHPISMLVQGTALFPLRRSPWADPSAIPPLL